MTGATMKALPVFFESQTSKEGAVLPVIGKIRLGLFKKKIFPLPFANNPSELNRLLHAMREAHQQPLLFVINTHGIEDLLNELDLLMGETPVLFFRREIVWLKTQGNANEGPGLTTRLSRLTPRLTAIWRYGSKNYEDLVKRAVDHLEHYESIDDFRKLEAQGTSQEVMQTRISMPY